MKNISENRDDEFENSLAGCPILGHEKEIPCLAEGGCFMSSDEYKTIEVHPYKKQNSNINRLVERLVVFVQKIGGVR